MSSSSQSSEALRGTRQQFDEKLAFQLERFRKEFPYITVVPEMIMAIRSEIPDEGIDPAAFAALVARIGAQEGNTYLPQVAEEQTDYDFWSGFSDNASRLALQLGWVAFGKEFIGDAMDEYRRKLSVIEEMNTAS